MKKKLLIFLAILSIIIFALTACSVSGEDASIIKIEVNSLASYDVYQNDTLNLNGASLDVYYSNGDVVNVPITQDMVSAINANVLGEQSIEISYKEFKQTVKINVIASKIQSISLNTQPSVFSVVEGEKLNTAGISLKLHYQTSQVIVDSITASNITGYTTETPAGTHEVFVTYAGFSTPITLVVYPRELDSITVLQKPTKQSYFVLESDDDATDGFNPSGLKIQLNYNNGTEVVVPYNVETMADFAFDRNLAIVLPLSKVTVTYLGKYQTTFNIAVLKPTVSNVAITKAPITTGFEFVGADGSTETVTSPITQVIVGDTIDWSTGLATLTYDDGTVVEDVPLNHNSFSITKKTIVNGKVTYTDFKGSNYEEIGLYTIRLLYGNMGNGTELSVTVVDKSAKELLLANESSVTDNITYFESDKIKVDMVRYNILYDNGTYLFDVNDTEEWDHLTTSQLSASSQSTAITMEDGTGSVVQVIEYEVEGVFASFAITVNELVITQASLVAPIKSYYKQGETKADVNFAGASYTVLYNNSKSVTVDLQSNLLKLTYDGVEVDSFDAFGNYEATVVYDGYESASFTLACKDVVVDSITVDYTENAKYLSVEEAIADFQNYNFKVDYTEAGFETQTIDFDGKDTTSGLMANQDEQVSLYTAIQGVTGYIQIQFKYMGVLSNAYNITIAGRLVTKIEVKEGKGIKTAYFAGQDFDYSGLVVIMHYNDGKRAEVDYFNNSNWIIEVPTIPTLEEMVDDTYATSFIVTYIGNEGVADIEIPVYVKNEQVQSIEYSAENQIAGLLNSNLQLLATKGDSLITTGLFITVNYESGATAQIPLQADYINYDRAYNKVGEQILTITYGDCTAEIKIFVLERVIESIEIEKLPTIMVYVNGQKLDLSGGIIKRIYNDGTVDFVNMKGNVDTNYIYNYFDTSDSTKELFSQSLTLTLLSNRDITVALDTEVKTYRKVSIADYMSYTNTTSFYGSVTDPRIIVTPKESIFIAPEITLYYMVDDQWTTVRPSIPGIYSIKVETAENEYFLSDTIENENYVLTITKKIIDIVIDNADKKYNDTDPQFTYTPEGLVGNDKIELTLYRDYGEDAGVYTILFKLQEGDNQNDYYYIDRKKDIGVLTINKAVIEEQIYFTGTEGLYEDGSSKIITATYVRSGITKYIKDSDLIITNERGEKVEGWPKTAGTYTIKVNEANYTCLKTYSATFTINAQSQS